jgi:DNA-binding SARP family transcriptional activator
MDFRILGPVEVCRDGQPLPLGGTKRRALLAIFVLHANEVVSPDRLIDDLWGERPPRNVAAALHNHVSRLRKLLGPDVLVTHPGGYCLHVDPASIDLNRFERLVGEAAAAPPPARAALLHDALASWRGPALADLTFEPVASEAIRLEESRLAALESRIDADLELGRHAHLVGELEALVADHPLRERLRGQLILALYRAGRQAESLEVYRATRRVLAEELGLDPSPELRELERAILRQDPTLASPPEKLAPSPTPVAMRRAPVVLAFAVIVVLAAAAVAASLGMRASSPARLSAREPERLASRTTASPVVSPETTAARPKAASRTKPSRATTTKRPVQVVRRPNRVETPAPVAAPGPKTPEATPKPTPKPTKERTTPTPKQSLRITDDFSAGFPDPLVWHYVGRENGTAFDASGGRLEIAVAPDAKPDAQWNQVGGHVGTRCRFDGDFDARVDFELLQWPTASNVYAGLNAIYADSAVVRHASSRWGDNYAAWVIPSNAGVELADRSGRLRLRREGATMTTYFWHDGAWVRLARGTSRGSAVLALQAQANGDEFARVPVRVAFDNFVVEAPDADCPPGSDPRDA